MYFLYLDESGSNTSHFILLGLAIPALTWRNKTDQITPIKRSYELQDKEIHTGWMLRRYLEQERIPGFENLDYYERRKQVDLERKATLLHISALGNKKKLQSYKKLFKKTHAYRHLTYDQRKNCLNEMADLIGSWRDSRLFAEATDRNNYNLQDAIYENAFSQVISRFDSFLRNFSRPLEAEYHGLVIHDQNKAVALQLTTLMKKFHIRGTIWTSYTRIIETPLFVDSELTEMVQLADVCAYATRRFFENNETELFDKFYGRFDRIPNGPLVGIRHYTGLVNCHCKVCNEHG